MRIKLVVSKWGNGLGVRLPPELAKRLYVGEGDVLIAEVPADERPIPATQGCAVDKIEARRLRRFLAGQKETAR